MLKSEFDERMGQESTQAEFERANIVYSQSSLFKTEFCEFWKKSNELVRNELCNLCFKIEVCQKMYEQAESELDAIKSNMGDEQEKSNHILSKWHIYKVYIEDGDDVYKCLVPAYDEEQARDYVRGNGEVIAIKELEYSITSDIENSNLTSGVKGVLTSICEQMGI